MEWTKLADEKTLENTVKALKANGFETMVVGNGEEAKKAALGLIPEGSEVFTVTSTTVNGISLAKELNESGRFGSVRGRLTSMDRNTQGQEMKKLGGVPEWVVGSVHAVTMDGRLMVASASGSQIPPYSYGAKNVLLIVGTQKIVKDIEEGTRRIYERALPLENERAMKAYGQGSSVNEILIINRQRPGRITVILVKELLGF